MDVQSTDIWGRKLDDEIESFSHILPNIAKSPVELRLIRPRMKDKLLSQTTLLHTEYVSI